MQPVVNAKPGGFVPRPAIPFPTPQQLADPSQARWKLRVIAPPITAHHEEIEQLLRQGWEPFGNNGDGLYLRRRPLSDEALGAVVVDSYAHSERGRLVRSVLPGWRQLRPLQRLEPDATFVRIVMLWRPSTDYAARWAKYLKERIRGPTKKLEYLI